MGVKVYGVFDCSLCFCFYLECQEKEKEEVAISLKIVGYPMIDLVAGCRKSLLLCVEGKSYWKRNASCKFKQSHKQSGKGT